MINLNEREKQRLLEGFRKYYFENGGRIVPDCPAIFNAGLIGANCQLTLEGSQYCLSQYPSEPDVLKILQTRDRITDRINQKKAPGETIADTDLLALLSEADQAIFKMVAQYFEPFLEKPMAPVGFRRRHR